MNSEQVNLYEYQKRGAIKLTGCDFVYNKFYLFYVPLLKTPTKFDFFLAYVTMTIPAAMLARITHKITGRKGTPLEDYLMNYYFDMSVKLLRKD